MLGVICGPARSRRALLVGIAVLISPCLTTSGCGPCEDYAAPGIRLNISDGHTGRPLSGKLRAWAVDGDYIDEYVIPDISELRDASNISLTLTEERPGAYAVYVQVEGYEPWSQGGVPVWRDGLMCAHVSTFTLDVRLRPIGSP